MNPWQWRGLALFGGALLPLAFAPLQWVVFAFVSPALFFLLCYHHAPRAAAQLGFIFGLGFFAVGVSWVYVAIHDFGYTGAVIASLLTLLFVAALALFFAGQAWLSSTLLQQRPDARASRGLAALLLLPAIWVLFEWWRGWFLTGFPWLSLGYSQTDTWLSGYAPVVGVFGVSWMVAVIGGALWLLLARRQRRALFLGLGLFVLGWGLQQIEWTQPTGARLSVSLVQGNMPQMTKWDPEQVALRKDTYATLTQGLWDISDVIVWPENAMTLFYHDLREDYLDVLSKQAHRRRTELVIGTPVMNLQTGEYYSSFVSLGPSSGVYHKRHLVPFGEFVPLEDLIRGLVNFFDLPMSGFSRGDAEQPLLEVAGQPLAASICYEDAFGEELIRSLPRATLLLNGSNNAWYGNSWAPHQHLQISRMRSIETGRDMIRATTNGISAYIDYRGKLKSRTPQFIQTVLTDTVQPRQGGTPYVTTGNYLIVSLMLLLIAGVLFVWRRASTPA
ncbi:MAG: apolipoprotein N-acyltransferase [Gammaproteobacteria bacterium]